MMLAPMKGREVALYLSRSTFKATESPTSRPLPGAFCTETRTDYIPQKMKSAVRINIERYQKFQHARQILGLGDIEIGEIVVESTWKL